MINWYKIMTEISGSLILIAVVITSYKFIVGGYSIEKRNEAKDSLMRLFFGAVSILVAPLFVKFLLLLNNNLVHMIVGLSNGSLNDLLGISWEMTPTSIGDEKQAGISGGSQSCPDN